MVARERDEEITTLSANRALRGAREKNLVRVSFSFFFAIVTHESQYSNGFCVLWGLGGVHMVKCVYRIFRKRYISAYALQNWVWLTTFTAQRATY